MSWDKYYKSDHFDKLVSFKACQHDLTETEYRQIVRESRQDYSEWETMQKIVEDNIALEIEMVDVTPILKRINKNWRMQ